MRAALRRLPLERAVQLSIFVTITGAMLASSSHETWVAAGKGVRALGLVALAAAATLYGIAGSVDRPRVEHWLAATLVAVAVASAAWSVDPRESVLDAGGFAAMVYAAALLGLATARRPRAVAAVADAVLAAVAAVALAGLVLLAVDPDRAWRDATPVEGARFWGIGGNANTAAMLFALGLPLAAGLWARSTRRLHRVVAALLALLFAGSIVASGSRGALVAGFVGLAAAAAVAPRTARQRAVAVAGVVVAFAVGVAASSLPDPDPRARIAYLPPTEQARTGDGFYNANAWRRLEDDLGHPPFGVAAEREDPSLLGSSGRAEAWEWAIRSGLERPVAGYGFGQEDRGFTDRIAAFEADIPENAYVGIFLQLGIAGLGLLLAFVAALAWRARGVRATGAPALAAGLVGVGVAGLILAVVQSYVYSPGAVASAASWLCAFALAAVTVPGADAA